MNNAPERPALKAVHPREPREASFLPSPKQLFVILAAYFSLHLILRTLVSETVGFDEADEVLAGQRLSWGYGPQPPLYTWLVILFTRTFGLSVFSLTLLRELILCGCYLLTYFNTRTLTRSHACGVAAVAALQLCPSIAWEAQRDLTHSILASAMVLALLLIFLRLQPRRWAGYVALGLCGGLSILSKYNAALFYFGMLLSAISLPGLRPLVLNRRMALALAISLLVALPNVCWALSHRDLAFASVYKLGIRQEASWWETVPGGLAHWVGAVSAHVAAPVLTFAVLFWRPIFIERVPRLQTDSERLLLRTLLIIFATVVLSVVVLRVTGSKDRWLQPILVTLPILLVAALRGSLQPARLKTMLLLGAIITALIVVFAPGRLLLTEWLNKRERLNAPFRRFAADLAPLAQRSDSILTGDSWLAGNLRLWFPERPLLSLELTPFSLPPGTHCLLVWDATTRREPPPALLKVVHSFTGADRRDAATYVQETWKYHHTKMMRLGLLLLEKPEPHSTEVSDSQ